MFPFVSWAGFVIHLHCETVCATVCFGAVLICGGLNVKTPVYAEEVKLYIYIYIFLRLTCNEISRAKNCFFYF